MSIVLNWVQKVSQDRCSVPGSAYSPYLHAYNKNVFCNNEMKTILEYDEELYVRF